MNHFLFPLSYVFNNLRSKINRKISNRTETMILKATTELYKDNKLAWPRSRFLAKFTVLLPNSGKVLLKAKYAGRLWDTVFMENMTTFK